MCVEAIELRESQLPMFQDNCGIYKDCADNLAGEDNCAARRSADDLVGALKGIASCHIVGAIVQ